MSLRVVVALAALAAAFAACPNQCCESRAPPRAAARAPPAGRPADASPPRAPALPPSPLAAGHGWCDENDACICFRAPGTGNQHSSYIGADCSQRVCPYGRTHDFITDSSQELQAIWNTNAADPNPFVGFIPWVLRAGRARREPHRNRARAAREHAHARTQRCPDATVSSRREDSVADPPPRSSLFRPPSSALRLSSASGPRTCTATAR
jgi:hypothetical protein